jgi:hypothetical protein
MMKTLSALLFLSGICSLSLASAQEATSVPTSQPTSTPMSQPTSAPTLELASAPASLSASTESVLRVEAVNSVGKNSASRVTAFVNLEWRAFLLGGHLSHGPAFSAGASFLRDHLKVGIAGFGRPGPWNPAEFEVKLSNGVTYKGKDTLSLRSDGGMVGAQIAGAFRLSRLPVAIELPVLLGFGGFGFYLQGEDRITPDGDRVSVWEDLLFNDTDSFIGPMLEGGIRAALTRDTERVSRPYLAVQYTLMPGFQTTVQDGYSGLSFALGAAFGRGL